MPRYTKRQKSKIKDKILETLSSGDISFTALMQQDNMPSRMTIYRWQSQDPEFDKACNLAEKGGYDRLASQILNKFEDLDFNKLSTRCADTIMVQVKKQLGQEITQEQFDLIKEIVTENALDPRFANAEVQKVTNQFRAVMSFLSKRHPSKYGDKMQIDHQIDDKREKTPEELEFRLTQLMEQQKKLTKLKH